ncbi:MAG TPA: DegT/DnrJ/EryC1/StrS family aminotransferase [Candidatus Paceibacterota bacterium]|nr:DegT/DnrJ/EryC1/StrS family aminotransferase [Candidatus Paceibacterota bacterium]
MSRKKRDAKIPLSKASIGKEEERAVVSALRSGWLTHGYNNKAFEEAFAGYIGVKHAITMNSCTSALFLALVANDITGEVILPSFTFVASANAIVTAGATPVFADVDYATRMLDPKSVEKCITKKTQAIMVVHYAGQPGPLKELQRLCKKHDLLLIEDSAEAIGCDYQGKKAGSFGIGCFSFFPTKNITAGEGGMFTTNDEKLAEKVSALIAHGIDKKKDKGPTPGYRSARYAGYNFRMSNILAAIGVEQMKKIDGLNRKRQKLAREYDTLLRDVSQVATPTIAPGRTHVYQMYTITVPAKDRDALARTLIDSNIEASVHFIPAVHQQIFYKKNYKARVPLRVTERLCGEILTLPMYPDMSLSDVKRVCAVIKTYFAAHARS